MNLRDKDSNSLFYFYSHFASDQQIIDMEKKYQEGVSWGEVKQETFEVLNEILIDKREIYEHYLNSEEELNSVFKKGALRAREVSRSILDSVKQTIF